MLQYIPANKIIEVVQEGEYTFGVQEELEDPLIETCYYEADTGQKGVFDIQPPSRRSLDQRAEIFNIITTLGIKGLCQIQVMKVDDKGPNKWMLTPAYFDEEQNEIKMDTIEFSVRFYYKTGILRSVVTILDGSGFFNHLITPEGVELESCELKVNDMVIPLDLQGADTVKGADITKNIQALGHGLCGFKYTNGLYDEVNKLMWTLTAKSKKGRYYRNEFKTRVNIDSGLHHQTRYVVLGTAVTIRCGVPITQPFCALYNPQNQMIITEDCKYSISSFAFHHLGTWKCYSGSDDALETAEYTVTYQARDDLTVLPIVEETTNALRVGCRVIGGSGSLSKCTLTAPNRRPFNVRLGTATDRYLTLGTDFNKGVCVIEIQKPLLSFEHGYWSCNMIGPNRIKYGGTYLKVGRAKPPTYTKRSTVVTELNKTLTVHCEVPYTTDYCFIISPNGTKYTNEDDVRINLGQCSFTIQQTYPSDNGTWMCTYARKTGIPNENIIVEVVVSDILRAYPNIEVDAGNNAQLLCNTVGVPLAYCQFTAPNGTIYHVRKEDSTTDLRYYGKGLERGECGISLIKARTEDSGPWRCAVALIRDEKRTEIAANVMLTVVPPSEINVAGLGIGVAVALLVVTGGVGFLVYLRWRRRRHQVIELGEDIEMRSDTISNSSSESRH
ncbi:hypothetical protein PPYR_14069 [Photinus pyralis]|uniref:Immunoglobulin domain-containing protein n=1 Tax=Photinus pyralis TaxID=7054 RepID=A0A5N4A486_PHOPY|nr:hypothetical protein PPYR_14069 [Photinus pyralis]